MQRRNASELFHLSDGKVADSDGADLALLEQGTHDIGGFFDCHQRIGPVHLIDVDIVGLKPTQGILDLLQDSHTAGIAEHLSIFPLKPSLGGNKDARAQATFCNRLADYVFRPAEAIARSGIDDVDAVFNSCADGGDRVPFIGSAPHRATNGPCTDSDARYIKGGARNPGKLHVDLESLGLLSHDPDSFSLLVPTRPSERQLTATGGAR